MKTEENFIICVELIIIALLLLMVKSSILVPYGHQVDPFAHGLVYFELFLCGATGVPFWISIQVNEKKEHTWLMLISLILFMIVLGITYHSWLINILGFVLFVLAGFIAALEFNEMKRRNPDAAT